MRELLRFATERNTRPSTAVFVSRALPSSPESGSRAGYDGAKRRKRSKTHIVVDTLGHPLVLLVIPSDDQDRAKVAELAVRVQAVTGESVELVVVDQGYTAEAAAENAAVHRLCLEVVSLP